MADQCEILEPTVKVWMGEKNESSLFDNYDGYLAYTFTNVVSLFEYIWSPYAFKHFIGIGSFDYEVIY